MITKHRAGPVTVALTGDEVSVEDVSAYLRRTSDVRLVSDPHQATAQVLLVLARAVGPKLVGELKAVTSAAVSRDPFGHRRGRRLFRPALCPHALQS